jgi:MoaA/NifB/PqqE/SkfB family radical SAM enzyme
VIYAFLMPSACEDENQGAIVKPMLLPWVGGDVPHAVLDINRDCNISCRGCYNLKNKQYKSMEQIEADQRKLHTVTIVGGEPPMHPALCDVISLANSMVSRVTLVTNGVLLDERTAGDWRRAGLDLVLIHIDAQQARPDLPSEPSRGDLDRLRLEKAEVASEAGLQVGMQAIFGATHRISALVWQLMKLRRRGC